jgi:chemotaxis protein CheC
MSLIKNPLQHQIKALKELGNIGAAHAVTGISKLLNQRVDISVSHADIVPVQEIMDVFEDTDSMVSVGCVEETSARVIGNMFVVFHQQQANRLIELITGKPPVKNRTRNEYDLSVLKEVGNIMCACYFHTLSTVLDKKLMHSVPEIVQEKIKDAMNITAGDHDNESNYAVMLETKFELTNGGIKGTMFFVSTLPTLDEIFNALERS